MKFGIEPRRLIALAAVSTLFGTLERNLHASENVPHAPFAEWANVPDRGQLLARLTYQESESYYIWAGNNRYKTDWIKNGEHYGIDINQGYLSLQYGLTEKWAADVSVGYTTSGWRYFSNFSTNGASQSSSGLMDISFGFRYQIFQEGASNSPSWAPTMTFRTGVVLPGTFDEHFPFAPGTSSTAIEPEILMRKHFGWTGLGGYFDGLYRWNHTSANDQYIISFGFFQQIQRWELNAGYRHLGSVNGDNIQFDPNTRFVTYPRAPRENQDSIEAGFSYMTKKKLRMGFYSRTVFEGTNSDKKFWLGGFFEMPFQLGKSK